MPWFWYIGAGLSLFVLIYGLLKKDDYCPYLGSIFDEEEDEDETTED